MSKPTATWAEFQELFKQAKRLEGHPQHNLWLYANVHGLMLYPEDTDTDKDKRRCFIIKLLQDEIVQCGPEFKEEFHALLQKQYGGKLVDILMANGKKNYETDFAAAENAGIVVGTVTAKAIADSISLRAAFDALAEGGKEVTMPFPLKTKDALYSMSRQTFEKHAWSRFRSVAHYWAARTLFSSLLPADVDESLDPIDQKFYAPSRREVGKRDGLAGFFDVADSYLYHGATRLIATAKPPRPLLDITKCYYLVHPFTPEQTEDFFLTVTEAGLKMLFEE